MTYDYSMFVGKCRLAWELYCNLIRGDVDHNMDQYIMYNGSNFMFFHYGDTIVEEHPLPDYTVMDSAALFQESLVFDKKYLFTLEEIIIIEQNMKKCEQENRNRKYYGNYYFNLGIPE